MIIQFKITLKMNLFEFKSVDKSIFNKFKIH